MTIDLCEGELPLKANIGKIQQVILNLLSNARDAMDDCEEKEIIIVTKIVDDEYYLAVSDLGEGIPKDKHEKVFKKFYTSKPTGKGTGLGLDIIQSIIKSYDGRIRVESEPGKGATFIINFPRNKS